MGGVLVDADTDRRDYNGLPIYDRKSVTEKFDSFNVILGHSRYELGEHIKEQIPNINKVFYAFSVSYKQYDKVPYSEIEQNADRFVKLCNDVADEQFVKNLLAYLNTKMTGDVSYIFDVYEKQMNFYNNDVFKVTQEEVLYDIGAYDGDTIRLFLEETDGKYKKIIALEPDDKSFLELNDYVAKNRMPDVITSKMGAWNCTADLKFESGNEQLSSVSVDGESSKPENFITIYAERIDKIFDEPATCIKINYLDGVFEAIEGCEGIIRKYLPKLVMDVGFEIYNVLKLYEYIKGLDLGYKFYLRFNRAMTSPFTLYAVTK